MICVTPSASGAANAPLRKENKETEFPRKGKGLMRDVSETFDTIEALKKAASEKDVDTAGVLKKPSPDDSADKTEGEKAKTLPASVVVKQNYTIVRNSPTAKARRRAVVMKGARIPVFEEADGAGCPGRWFRVYEEGWICESDVTLSTLPPEAPEYPIVPDGEITPWPYGFVREDTLEYRLNRGGLEEVREVLKGFGFGIAGTARLSDIGYFRTAEGTLIPRKDAGMTDNISEFEGMALTEGKPWPIGFVFTRNAHAWSEPSRLKKNLIAEVERYTPFEVLETAGKGKNRFYRFDEGGWLSATDVRVAAAAPIPSDIAPGEKWIDVNTNAQIITAYEGETPVYVTLISSGRFGSPTVKGEYRIWSKISAIPMDNTDEQLEEETETTNPEGSTAPAETETDTDTASAKDEPHLYSLHDVPWTQFFFESFALHGVYWHNGFGNRRSHGCVNLSPKDAKWFYKWTEPTIRDGFWAVHATKNHPGTLVRVR